MDWLISELKKRWVSMGEITRGLHLSSVLTLRLLDKLTMQYLLAEEKRGKSICYKILSEEDFNV
jgi:hypothetical protein